MDTLAHTLWAAAGLTAARRRWPIATSAVAAGMVLAALPDVLHVLPVAGWAFWGEGSPATILRYAVALPGQEPTLPPAVALTACRLHCLMHSALVAGGASLAVLAARPEWRVVGWAALFGWWSHILIDVFTHSNEFYPVTVFYPLSEFAFDGLAWTTPGFQLLNYAALCGVLAWLLRRRG